jgi:hypothetical protein
VDAAALIVYQASKVGFVGTVPVATSEKVPEPVEVADSRNYAGPCLHHMIDDIAESMDDAPVLVVAVGYEIVIVVASAAAAAVVVVVDDVDAAE